MDFDTETSDVLRAWKVAQLEECLTAGSAWNPGEWVFTNEVGRPHNPEWMSKRFRKLIVRSDLSTITMRELRHSHAKALLQAGVHPKVVQERLGYSSIRMTMDTYSSVLPTMQRGSRRTAHADDERKVCQVPVPGRHFGSGSYTTLPRGLGGGVDPAGFVSGGWRTLREL